MALTSGYTGLASFNVIITHCIIESVILPTQPNVLHYIENLVTQSYITWGISNGKDCGPWAYTYTVNGGSVPTFFYKYTSSTN